MTVTGGAPWPPTYQGRLRALEDQRGALRALLAPLHDAAKAFHVLGALSPGEGIEVGARWPLPMGAVLVVRAGYHLHTDVGKIGEGVIPPPDPMLCLASALCTPELWDEAMAAYRQATDWAAQQAAEYGL